MKFFKTVGRSKIDLSRNLVQHSEEGTGGGAGPGVGSIWSDWPVISVERD